MTRMAAISQFRRAWAGSLRARPSSVSSAMAAMSCRDCTWVPCARNCCTCSGVRFRMSTAASPETLAMSRPRKWPRTSRAICTRSHPPLTRSSSRASACATSPARRRSASSKRDALLSPPRTSRRCSPRMVPSCSEKAQACSRRTRASRMPPSQASEMKSRASSSWGNPSLVHTAWRWARMSFWEMRRKSKRWQRETMVAGTFWGSVVARMNTTWGGGSSRVLSRALKAELESLCTSSMT